MMSSLPPGFVLELYGGRPSGPITQRDQIGPPRDQGPLPLGEYGRTGGGWARGPCPVGGAYPR